MGNEKTKVTVHEFKSDAGDVHVAIDYGAKYCVEVVEYQYSPISGHGGTRYFHEDTALKAFLDKVNAKPVGTRYIEVDFNK